MTKQFEATLIRMCQIDSECVMSFRAFFNNPFSYLFISFSSIIAWFEMDLLIWVAGNIKIWYFTLMNALTPS